MFMSQAKFVVVPIVVLLLTSCSAGSAMPTRSLEESSIKHRTSPCPCLYVVDNSRSGITVYRAGASGNVAPIQQLLGKKTKLDGPLGIAVDGSENMYVANSGGSVTIYAAGATGNVAPMATIAGSKTKLDAPQGIALDPVNGDLYVANGGGGPSGMGSITIYSPDSNGNVAPIGTIEGATTDLDSPYSVALDASGNIYVTNNIFKASANSIFVYAAGSTGDVAPSRTISGNDTKLSGPAQVALDSSSNVYVANFSTLPSSGSIYYGITVYAAGANGNAAPIRTIVGSKTKLDGPRGVAVDAGGTTYATNYYANSIAAYAAGANGNVKPIRIIKGSHTKLSYPNAMVAR